MRSTRRSLAILVPALVALCLWNPARGEATRPTLGVVLDVGDSVAVPAADSGAALRLRVVAQQERLKSAAEWNVMSTGVATLSDAGHEIALVLDTAGLPDPTDQSAVDSWIEFLREGVRRTAGKVDVIQIQRRVEVDRAVSDYGYLLKAAVVAVRAEAEAAGAEIRVAQGAIEVDEFSWQRELWGNEIAAYVEILPVVLDVGEPEAIDGVSRALNETLRHPPASEVWIEVAGSPAREALGWQREALALEALSLGATVATVALDFDTIEPPHASERIAWLHGTARLLSADHAPAPLGTLMVQTAEGEPLEGGRALARFFDGETFSTLIFYLAPGEPEELPSRQMTLDTSLVRNARVVDLIGGETLRVGSRDVDGSRVVRVAGSPRPMALLFEKGVASPGFDVERQQVESDRSRELSAEEIIARNREVQQVQDDRLERWMARGRIDFHFKLAQGGSNIDVSIGSNYFWERDGDVEWEQTDYYVNGNLVRWKKIPQLPLIQPEKVITLPLDLTLDRTYRYRKVGRAKVRGREAYILAFEPDQEQAARSLYRGRVWIDAETFVRVKTSVVQTRLSGEVLANEEIDLFLPHPGPDGELYWMLTEATGQQIWKAAGRNFIVQREVTFESFEINPDVADFEARREAAYASSNRMLRDTDEGFRYLEPDESGKRVLADPKTSQLFAAAGAFQEASGDDIQPLAGVNYFDYDLFGKGLQFNGFFGGVVGFATLSDPDLFGTPLDLTIDAALFGIRTGDEVFLGADELLEEEIERRNQRLALRLGIPIGKFSKLSWIGGMGYREFSDGGDGRDARELYNLDNPSQSLAFVLPDDHVEVFARLEAEFNRRGYNLSLYGQSSSRKSWDTWGLFDTTSDQFVEFDPATELYVDGAAPAVEDRYALWGGSFFKEWFLPKFQKVRGEINYLDGADLDRFSNYEFNIFGDDRLFGFAGSGVRFDQGVIGRAGYSFNLLEVIRFDVALEQAQVENSLTDGVRRSFTGVGLSANLVGPWQTVINLNYGYALNSDIPDLEGESEFLLLVFKLF